MVGGIAEDIRYLPRFVFFPSLYQRHEVGIDEHAQAYSHEISHVTVVSLQRHVRGTQSTHAYQCHALAFEPLLRQLQTGLPGAGASAGLVVKP